MLNMIQSLLNYEHEDERLMTGKKQPKMTQTTIREKYRITVQNTKDQFPNPVFYRVSTKPFASLNRTSVSHLLVNVPSEGNYLLLRTLELPVKNPQYYDQSILVPVEDHLGNATMCCLYGYVYLDVQKPVEYILPVYTVFALKEPCLKYCSVGNFAVVVGSPSDFIKIDRSHALAKDVENLGWRKKITIEMNSQLNSKLAMDWKVMGNDCFTNRKFEQAKEAYLVALGFPKNPEIDIVLHLNLAAVYLNQGFFELTIRHTNIVLEMEAKNEKALFRAGRANYELRQYENAKERFESLLREFPLNAKAASELDRCVARLDEASGNIDVYRLFCLNRINPTTSIDCSNYIGPVKLFSSRGKTRGMFATEDLKPGTLVLVEKSVVILNSIFDSHQVHGQGLKGLPNAVGAVFRNPRTFGRQIMSVCNDMSEIVFCDEENSLEPIIDVKRIFEIVSRSSFLSEKKTDYRHPTISQLFSFAPAISHSCMSNSTFMLYNDIILVRTCSFIKKDEEITISLWSNDSSYSQKQFYVQMFGHKCKCLLCATDATEAADIHTRREALRNDMSRLVSSNCEISARKLLKIVKQLEETYKNRSLLRVYLLRAYLNVAHSFMKQAAEGWEKLFTTYIERGLEAVGLSIELLLSAAENEDSYLPRNALFWEDLFDYAALIVEKESVFKRTEYVIRWVKVLMFLERVFRGGNLEMLRNRFKDRKEVEHILSKITD